MSTKPNHTILKRYLSKKKITEEDQILLDNVYNLYASKQPALPTFNEEELTEIGKNIFEKLPMAKNRKLKRLFYAWSTVAAAILLILGYLLFSPYARNTTEQSASLERLPLQNKNILAILPDGKEIALDAAKSGLIIANGTIKYTDGSKTDLSEIENQPQAITIKIPKGAQYSITLSDGTMVVLNAESQIRYPLTFHGDVREVYVEGEAFFNVKKEYVKGSKALKPFIVHTPKQEISVKGTSFNVREYFAERLAKTSVNTGIVTVKSKATNLANTIYPNEISLITDSRSYKDKVDAPQLSSWKEGYFIFEDASLEEVAESIARWYNISVRVANHKNNEKFQGKISNKDPLSKILSILKESGIKYHMTTNQLILQQ